MKESVIEQYLVRRCRALGILCYKFVSPSNLGVPDRILIFPYGTVLFMELKAPGKKPTKLQIAVHQQMIRNRAEVLWAGNKEGVNHILSEWGEKDLRNSIRNYIIKGTAHIS